MDEILWLKRQDQSIRETQVIARIGLRIDSGAVPADLYREFATEIKNLVPHDRFTLFTVNRQDDLLTCVFRVTGQEEPGLPYPAYPLSASGFGLIAASCQGQLVDDLRDGSKPRWPELGDGSVLRSALLAPVLQGGATVGVAVLESRFPKAYDIDDESLLLRTAPLLGPAMAKESSNRQSPAGDPGTGDQVAVERQIALALASSESLAQFYHSFALAAGQLLEFDLVTLAYLDPNGWAVATMDETARGGRTRETDAFYATQSGSHSATRTTLRFGGEIIGALAFWRRGEAFRHDELGAAEILSVHVSAAVQHQRLRSLAYGQTHFSPTEPGSPLEHSGGRGAIVDPAHALRTPLSSIKGYSSSLLMGNIHWPPEIRREFLETIDREADNLDGAITEVLAAIVSGSSVIQLDWSEFTPQELLQSTADFLATEGNWLAGDHPGLMRLECEPGLPSVWGDLPRIAVALGYLARCAAEISGPRQGVLVRAFSDSNQPCRSIGPSIARALIGAAGRANDAGVTPRDGLHRPVSFGAGPRDRLGVELMLVATRNLLSAHGVELWEGAEAPGDDCFRFYLGTSRPNFSRAR